MRIEHSWQCDDCASHACGVFAFILPAALSSCPVKIMSIEAACGCAQPVREGLASVLTNPRNDNAAEVRGVVYSTRSCVSNYFDTDFLNMRSIFSFVASQQAWLA
jgi:hypothetical protein